MGLNPSIWTISRIKNSSSLIILPLLSCSGQLKKIDIITKVPSILPICFIPISFLTSWPLPMFSPAHHLPAQLIWPKPDSSLRGSNWFCGRGELLSDALLLYLDPKLYYWHGPCGDSPLQGGDHKPDERRELFELFSRPFSLFRINGLQYLMRWANTLGPKSWWCAWNRTRVSCLHGKCWRKDSFEGRSLAP